MEYQLFIRIIKGELGFTVVATGDWFPCDDWFHGKLRYSFKHKEITFVVVNERSLYITSSEDVSTPIIYHNQCIITWAIHY